MILRRLADSINKQDWFTVVLEVLIVVVGIFIGLQVDGWNQARKDRADERIFLDRIHGELLASLDTRKANREGRVGRWTALLTSMDVVFGTSDRGELSDAECEAIYSTHIYASFVADLPSLNTLLATGRIGIISDEALQASFIAFDQRRNGLNRIISTLSNDMSALAPNFPEMIAVVPRPYSESNDIKSDTSCDLKAMRASQKFLNRFYDMADKFDAYFVGGLRPLVDSIETMHTLLDQNLGQHHEDGSP